MDGYREFIRSIEEGPYELTKRFATHLIKLLNTEEVHIFMYERHRNILRLTGTTSEKLEGEVGKLKILLDESSRFGDISEHEELVVSRSELLNVGEEGKMLLKPIVVDDELIGAIAFTVSDEEALLPGEVKEAVEEIGAALKLISDLSVLKDLRRRLEILEMLSLVHSQIMEPSFLLDATLKLAMDALNAYVGSIWLVENDELVLNMVKGLNGEKVIKNRVALGYGLVGWVALKKEPLLSVSTDKDERAALDIFDMEIKSAIAAPIDDGENILGVILLANRREEGGYRPYKHFDEFDLGLLDDIGRRLGVTLNRSELYKRLEQEVKNLKRLEEQHQHLIKKQQRQLERLRILQRISQAMRSSYDVNNAYKILLLGTVSGRGLGFNRALLLLRDRDKHVLKPKYWIGPASDEKLPEEWQDAHARAMRYGDLRQYLREEAILLNLEVGLIESIKDKEVPYRGNPVLERVVLRRKLVHVTKSLVESRYEDYGFLAELLGTEEFVVCPLSGRFDTLGVLIVDNKYTAEPFHEDDLEILGLLSDSAGLTIEAIESYEELRAKTLSLERQKDLVEYLRRFAESILQNLDAAIIVIDREDRIKEWNKKAEVIFGRPREHMLEMKLEEVSPEFFELQEIAGKVYDVGETITLSDYYMKLGNKEMFLDIRFSPLRNPVLGIIEGVIISVEDVTKRHQLEEELKRQERLAILGEMSARVAHELRNPITVIGGFVRRAQKKIDDRKSIEKYLGILQEEIERLEGIVAEILEFSKEARALDFSVFDLGTLVEDVLELYAQKIKDKGIHVVFNQPSGPVEIEADKNRIKQVVINLIQNAIEACNVGGNIRVTVDREGESAVFKVWNDGTPIPKDIMDKIFLPFFTTKTYGTGLGLPICKKIIEDEHGGKIFVESSEDGTIFTVIIPKNPLRKGE